MASPADHPAPSAVWQPITPARAQATRAGAVAVVLGYYNGNHFLPDQVRSIAGQTHRPVELFITDDASPEPVDERPLSALAGDSLPIHLRRMPSNQGFVRNFVDGLAAVPESFEYFAFSDQDDIWYPEKLSRAVARLQAYPPETPALYCARTCITDVTAAHERGLSPLFKRPPSFANALLQNIAGGNTMVFNRAARDLIVETSDGQAIICHDWWCYQIVTGAGGTVVYDERPCLAYRQHPSSIIGANNSARERLVRILGLLNGRYRGWNHVNTRALLANRDRLTPTNQMRLDRFAASRRARLPSRLQLFYQSGAYRQPRSQNAALWGALLLNRI